jgi:hypothetical protein
VCVCVRERMPTMARMLLFVLIVLVKLHIHNVRHGIVRPSWAKFPNVHELQCSNTPTVL